MLLREDSHRLNSMAAKIENSSFRTLRVVAALCGFAAVALGAFGAHALRSNLSALATVETWNTASLYHLVHSAVLFCIVQRGLVWIRFDPVGQLHPVCEIGQQGCAQAKRGHAQVQFHGISPFGVAGSPYGGAGKPAEFLNYVSGRSFPLCVSGRSFPLVERGQAELLLELFVNIRFPPAVGG